MKVKIILLFSILILSCSNENDKSQKLIKDFLRENLNDPSSYESISFGELEVGVLDVDKKDDGDCQFIEDLKTEILKNEIKLNMVTDNPSLNLGTKEKFEKELSRLKNELNSIDKEILKKCFKSFEMEHTYRCRNVYGGLEIKKTTFYFDTEISFVFVDDDFIR